MRRLVAFDIPPSAAFVDAIGRCHDAGDAVLPIDARLRQGAKERLLEALAPSVLLDADGSEHALPGGRPVEDGDAFVVATSGSTGTPKGVVLSHDAVAASSAAVHARLGLDVDHDAWLSCLPLAHVGGLSVVTRAIAAGVPLEVHRRFEPERVIAAAVERQATLVSLVPTALFRLGGHGSDFRKVVLGGSSPPSSLPENVVTTYGMTETGSGVVYDGVPLDGVEIRIDKGEILLRCPMLLRAYRDGHDPRDVDGYFHTGDGGELDRSGRLLVHGRLSELIVSGGENVWPGAVEAILKEVEGVAEVAVGGVADPEWGERVVAYVVAAAGTTVALEALREPVRDVLGAWAAPKELVLLDALPRTALGKVRRHELVGRALEPKGAP